MTTAAAPAAGTNGHTNGHANGVHPPGFPQNPQFGYPHQQFTLSPEAAALLDGLPAAAELDHVIKAAEEVEERKDAVDKVTRAATWSSLTAARNNQLKQQAEALQAEADHQERLLELRREEQQLELDARREEIRTKARQAAVAEEVERIRVDGELAAAKLEAEERAEETRALTKARERLRQFTDATAGIVFQARLRKLTVVSFCVIAGIAIAAGAVNVSSTLGRLFEIGPFLDPYNALLYVGLGIFEPFATVPLAMILLSRLTEIPRSYGRAPGRGVVRWAGAALKARWGSTEWRNEVLLLGVAVVLNVGPHLLLGERRLALLWLWVPTALAVSLRLGAHLVRKYDLRMVALIMDAEDNLNAGSLPPAVAKVFRHVRTLQEAIKSGAYAATDRELDEHGIPKPGGAYRTLRENHETVSKPAAYQAVDGLRVLAGVVK